MNSGPHGLHRPAMYYLVSCTSCSRVLGFLTSTYISRNSLWAIAHISMPKLTEKHALLNEVEEAMKLANFDALVKDDDGDSDIDPFMSDDDEESPLETLGALHVLICGKRYLNPRCNLARSRDYVLNYFLGQNDQCFRQITRVHRETFFHVIHLIEFDPVFHNVSTCPQAPVHWQLACALDRLGNDGLGVSHARSKLIWGIGQGTVHLYTRRVVKALWALRNQYIVWPSPIQRRQISRRMEQKGFKDAVGFVDGTTIPLHKKPAVYGNIFMDRKKRYSVNAQIVCDDLNRVQFFMTGHPGSMGDSRVFSRSILVKRPDVAFSGREYLLADSAYAISPRIIPPYKENQRDDRADPTELHKISQFNTYLAKARVVNEHTIGIMKSRWSSLRGMRVDIHKREDMKTFVRQVTACIVLHNICLENDPWDDEYVDDIEENQNEVVNQPLRQPRILNQGQRRRWEIRNSCIEFFDQE